MLRRIWAALASGRRRPAHSEGPPRQESPLKKIALVGAPNVGKSVMFCNLTGIYATVSNYPGTTVEVSRGAAEIAGRRYEVVDTPGMYSLMPISDDERVARSILLEERPDIVLHIVDARNLERMILLTYQLIEGGLPVILVLNMMDDARASGLTIDAKRLEEELGIPVVCTVSTTGEGMTELRRKIGQKYLRPSLERFRYPPMHGIPFESRLDRIVKLLRAEYSVSRRSIALFLLQGDEEIHEIASQREGDAYTEIRAIVSETQRGVSVHLPPQPEDIIKTV